MTITKITVMTMDKVYTENCYGLESTVDRLAIIENCDNVLGVEVINMETGEILYINHTYTKREIYVAETFVIDLITEILD